MSIFDRYISLPSGSISKEVYSYIKLPSQTIKGIEMWIYIDKNQVFPCYVFDARLNDEQNSYFYASDNYDDIRVGPNVNKILIDGVLQMNGTLPFGRLCHVYIEFTEMISTEMTLFSRYTLNESLKGKVYAVRTYDKELTDEEIRKLYNATLIDQINPLGEWIFNNTSGNKVNGIGGIATIFGGNWFPLIAHDNSQLTTKTCLPIDYANTTFLAHYDVSDIESLRGQKPLGLSKSYDFKSRAYAITEIKTDGLTNLTLEAWVYINDYESRTNSVVGSWETAGGGIEILSTGIACFNVYVNGKYNTAYSDKAIPLKQWIHLAGVYNNSEVVFYVNGIKQSTPVTVTGAIGISSYSIAIGCNPPLHNIFNGKISDVRVWNIALNSETIKSNIYTDYEPGTTGLLGSWKINEGKGTTFLDSSGNNRHVQVTNEGEWVDGFTTSTIVPGKFGGGIALEEATTNVLVAEAGLTCEFSNLATGTLPNPPGWGNNFNDRFGAGNWTSEVVDIHDLVGFSKAFKIKTTAPGAGGWASGWGTLADKPLIYSCWVKVISGAVHFGNLNSDNRALTGPTNGEWVRVSSEDPTYSLVYDGDGTHMYAMGPSEFYVAAVQAERRIFSTSFVNGTRKFGYVDYPPDCLNPLEGTVSFWFKSNIYDLNISNGHVESAVDSIIVYGDPGLNGFLFRLRRDGSEPIFEYESYDGSTKKIHAMIDHNTFHMYTLTWSSSGRKLYVDGKLRGSVDGNFNVPLNVFRLGRSTTSGHYGAPNGIIDELRIDRVARTEEEIESWYNVNSPFYPKGVHKISL